MVIEEPESNTSEDDGVGQNRGTHGFPGAEQFTPSVTDPVVVVLADMLRSALEWEEFNGLPDNEPDDNIGRDCGSAGILSSTDLTPFKGKELRDGTSVRK